jgi:type VI secretion system protein ImpJ
MLPRKVLWLLGMRTSPAHFQQQDRYVEESAKFRARALRPHAWGFTEFMIDEHLLNLAKVVVSKGAGIMPDGTLFELGHGTTALSIDIPPGTTSRRIMLSLPIAVEGGTEVRGPETAGLSTRYLRATEPVRDNIVYEGKPSQSFPIDLGTLDFQLLFEDDAALRGFVTMPVAKIVECRPDGAVILDKEFMPTFLHIEASAVLSSYLREIIGLLTHRGDHLAVRVSDANQTGTAELADFLLLQCINRMEPVFMHLSETPCVHPESFFRELLSLVGELSTYIAGAKRPAGLPVYDHGDQYATFMSIMLRSREVLSMVFEQHAQVLKLQQRPDGIKTAAIHDKRLLATASFILVAQADMDKEGLRNLLPKQIKIGTPENIRDLVNSHLPGVKIRPLPVAPRQIPFHAGKIYFRLEFSSKERAQFEMSTGCAIHVSGTFPGLQMEFWAIKE